MRREMLALDQLSICELHDKCLFMGIPKENADKCLNTFSEGRSHMLLVDLIVSVVTASSPRKTCANVSLVAMLCSVPFFCSV
jgi:hypothetical protein